jgi:hypothetical protein
VYICDPDCGGLGGAPVRVRAVDGLGDAEEGGEDRGGSVLKDAGEGGGPGGLEAGP